MTATSLSADGVLRWQQTIAGAERNGISQVLVDANGVVALQTHYEYPDPSNPSVLHLGVKVQFLSAQTGSSVLPIIEATDPNNGDFQMSLGGGVSIGPGRVYIPESGSALTNSVSAFLVPGLGQDYQSVLQASLTSSGDGALVVQSPPPTPVLTVTTANGGGGGTAGTPDPSSLEHGHCDPGDNTNWLHIAGVTFVCIGSLQVWNEPGLISARKKCIINLGIEVAPFLKLLKARKYVVAAGTVSLSLKTLAQRLAIASYPRKLAGDVQAVDDLRTALHAIKAPSRRSSPSSVHDGYSTGS